MRYRTLGDSGLLVSVVGLGCNNFGGRIDLQRSSSQQTAGQQTASQRAAG